MHKVHLRKMVGTYAFACLFTVLVCSHAMFFFFLRFTLGKSCQLAECLSQYTTCKIVNYVSVYLKYFES